MTVRAADRRLSKIVRSALEEFVACAEAWGGGVGLESCLDACARTFGERVSPLELALWAQDDNAGCQTGMLRQRGGAVLAWHTEEDTIGYLDRPRIASFAVGGEEWCAFVYPYLLPGPAFGWRPGQLHAVDSLYTRRALGALGTLSGVASWLVWRVGPEVEIRELLRSLAPFLDGCAIHVVSSASPSVTADCHEIAGSVVKSRSLGARAGSVSLQVNAVSQTKGPLGREEEMSRRTRGLYERRLARMRAGVARLPRESVGSGPQEVLRMLSSRQGGSYAYANGDVKAHAVALVAPSSLEVHVGAGPADASDVYAPRWRCAAAR
jgi:hypothetical protein